MIKRLLVLWLVTSILGLGLAFANGMPDEDRVHSHQFITDHSMSDEESEDDTVNHANHCHSSHLMGFAMDKQNYPQSKITVMTGAYSYLINSHISNTLYRPPIVKI